MAKQKPYRPFAIQLVNLIGRGLAAVGIRSSLEMESLIANAQKQTGLADFGDLSFKGPLSILLDSIEREARLHPFGRWIVRNRLLGILVTRLRVQELVTEHPEILELEITPPLVIAGIQRTGTTMLHRLLAADPQTRALASWEAISPMPHPRQREGEPERRIKLAEMAEKGLKYLAPEFFAIHPVEAEAPEEDVLLLEYSFMSQVPEATMRLPTYSAWLQQQDLTPAYEYLKVLLQVLHWQQPGQRWVLKTPAHLEHLDLLFKVFPSAKVIQTHRQPEETVASFSSMIWHGYGVFSDQIDKLELSAHWQRNNARMMQLALDYRATNPEAFLDVSYYQLIKEPMPQIERIYNFAGIALNAEARAEMDASRQQNKQNKHGKHKYTLEEFGTNVETVRRDYANYLERFETILKEHS